jgi:hypothetical protein
VRLRAGVIAVIAAAGMWQLAGCSVGFGASGPISYHSIGAHAFHARAVSPPLALRRVGVTNGRALLTWGEPLVPMAAVRGGVALGLPIGGVPFGSGRNAMAGYAVVRVSDGRFARLLTVHPSWDRGLTATADRLIWLEAGRQLGGYRWAVYTARGPGSPLRLLGRSRGLVPAAGVPSAVGVQGTAACWGESADGRHWVVVRRPVAGAGLTVTARVDDTVASCVPAGSETLVATTAGPADPPMSAGSKQPGNVFDVTAEGKVGLLLRGPHLISVLGDQVAYSSFPAGEYPAALYVARLDGHRLVGAHAVGPRGVSIFSWLDGRYLLAMDGPRSDLDYGPLLLVDARTGRSRTILAAGHVAWAATGDGYLLIGRYRSPPGLRQLLEIDEFGLPHP